MYLLIYGKTSNRVDKELLIKSMEKQNENIGEKK